MHEHTAAGYDAVANEYAARLFHELEGKPFDRDFLTTFARKVPPGTLLDLGCGPGHVGKFMNALGRHVTGVDISTGMVATARRLNPDLHFQQGDMRALELPASSFAGVVAFYSIIHLEPVELPRAASEIFRVLIPGGMLALAFHVGDDVRHVDDLWGIKTSLDFRFLQPAAVEAVLTSVGLKILQTCTRPPYAAEIEAQTARGYLLAVRPVEASE